MKLTAITGETPATACSMELSYVIQGTNWTAVKVSDMNSVLTLKAVEEHMGFTNK